jgi:steroid delta-isomerase-like uncharacterized protein
MSAQSNAEMARNLYAAFNRGDLDSCLALAAQDVEVVLIPFDQTFRGHDGFRDFMGGFKRAFPDLTVTVTNQVATEDQVVSECSWTGTHSGPLLSPTGEIPATHKSVTRAVFCEVWTIRDGKVAVLRNYQDVSTWLRQLGLVP